MLSRSTTLDLRRFALLFTGASFLFACASAPAAATKKKSTPIDPGDDFFDDPPAEEQGLSPTTNPDSGAFGASARPSVAGKDAGVNVMPDGGPSDGGVVAKTFCSGPLAAGDLVVSELMLSSRAGANDDGEWVEIKSARTCWLKLQGVTVESPRGALTNSTTIAEDFELEPGGTFVVADSLDPAKNHALPGKVFSWDALDALKNDGDSITVKLGATIIDTTTYPQFSNITAGRSLAFPSDCPANVRTDWTRWSLTFDSWKTGFMGTPNAANADVACY